MADQILYVKPARSGLVVLLADGSRLPEGGKRVPNNRILRRHMLAGDVVLCDPPKTSKPKIKRESTKESN